ncbi:hypothetical protein GW933_02210 [Candidatus Falkowbacteria bacterium]|uniref:Uncharacterized protein n=1 Tax=Candidatus Buchananbacteria bacterium CG10_big_fil_rev_8_21_14_0_10_33_19 TaxID=1974525 RepID=A0A2H0W5Y7_9BACT|nr:hypothetical protein [Candidatus Falkowbacteria bacterium]PIS06060.1 MAG: hypothetical protein COT80_04835 [Candidatus Buchananbacteria bacterium CG10_big_fil_rev_8_21_14_0_10_33_19]
MDTNITGSLEIAKAILAMKETELQMLVTVLQEAHYLSDELVCLLAEFWGVAKQEAQALAEAITSLEQQKEIFGNIGLPKEIEIASKEDYPDDQQPTGN